MKTIKQYFTLGEHAMGQNVKPFPSSELKWSYLIPDMPSRAAWIDTDPKLSTLLADYIWPEFYDEVIEVETIEVPDWANVEDQDIPLSDETRSKTGAKFYVWINQSNFCNKFLMCHRNKIITFSTFTSVVHKVWYKKLIFILTFMSQ